MLTVSTSDAIPALLGILLAVLSFFLKRTLDSIDKKLDKVIADTEANTAKVNTLSGVVQVHEFRLNALDGKGASVPAAKAG